MLEAVDYFQMWGTTLPEEAFGSPSFGKESAMSRDIRQRMRQTRTGNVWRTGNQEEADVTGDQYPCQLPMSCRWRWVVQHVTPVWGLSYICEYCCLCHTLFIFEHDMSVWDGNYHTSYMLWIFAENVLLHANCVLYWNTYYLFMYVLSSGVDDIMNYVC